MGLTIKWDFKKDELKTRKSAKKISMNFVALLIGFCFKGPEGVINRKLESTVLIGREKFGVM